MLKGLLLGLALWAAYKAGWVDAHITVAKECERLGAFYVNRSTFKCGEQGAAQ